MIALRQGKAFAKLEHSVQWTIQTILESSELIRRSEIEHTKTRYTIIAAIGETHAKSVEQRLLQSLRFSTMKDRHEEICEAHAETFEWLFQNPSTEIPPWTDFIEWLRDGHGLYWVKGKAGCGKSTVMRYILDSPKTTENLQAWSDGGTLITAGFFFWNSGTSEQRSQTGLFRSLLHQILDKNSDLVREIFPNEWAEGCSIEAQGRLPSWNWKLKDLQQAFTRLAHLESVSLKMCLVIDGLDEYEGPETQDSIVQFFKSVISPRLKIFVSSRPWLVFEEAWIGAPGLRLQDLTFRDIEAYVSTELENHRRMKQLALVEPEHATELVHEIVTKANGVFLWVTLVVRSLLQGLQNYDDISDLRARLQELPSDLGLFYVHMLRHVEPRYKGHASRTFQIFNRMLTIEGASGEVSALELELATTAFSAHAASTSWDEMSVNEMVLRSERMDVHLKSRCAGLLEIMDKRRTGKPGEIQCDSKSFLKVVYLHRTVKDFLEMEDVRTILLQDTASGEIFEPNTWILKSYITRLKKSVCLYDGHDGKCLFNNIIWSTVNRAMMFAREAAGSQNLGYLPLLDELDDVATRLWQVSDRWQWKFVLYKERLSYHWTNFNKPSSWQTNFLAEAVTMGICPYVETKLRLNSAAVHEKKGLPLLGCSVMEPQKPARSRPMLDLLLSFGADPNQIWQGATMWQLALATVHEFDWWSLQNVKRDEPMLTLGNWAHLFKSMLQHGSNPFATCSHNHKVYRSPDPDPEPTTPLHFAERYDSLARGDAGDMYFGSSHTVEDVVTHIFGRWLPREALELNAILRSQINSTHRRKRSGLEAHRVQNKRHKG